MKNTDSVAVCPRMISLEATKKTDMSLHSIKFCNPTENSFQLQTLQIIWRLQRRTVETVVRCQLGQPLFHRILSTCNLGCFIAWWSKTRITLERVSSQKSTQNYHERDDGTCFQIHGGVRTELFSRKKKERNWSIWMERVIDSVLMKEIDNRLMTP